MLPRLTDLQSYSLGFTLGQRYVGVDHLRLRANRLWYMLSFVVSCFDFILFLVYLFILSRGRLVTFVTKTGISEHGCQPTIYIAHPTYYLVCCQLRSLANAHMVSWHPGSDKPGKVSEGFRYPRLKKDQLVTKDGLYHKRFAQSRKLSIPTSQKNRTGGL